MEEDTNLDKVKPILHVLVIGFHHKKGCQVEYSYPPLVPGVEGTENECPKGWKYLPTLALPDGSHNFDEDTVYFHLPSLTDPAQTVFGISCFRQIPVEKIKNRTADITRGTVQKSVCVLSSIPLYGHIQVKMALITHAYFEEGDFTKVKLLKDTYHHLNDCLLQLQDIQAAPQLFVGLSARELILQFRHKALLLFKLLLLERRVVFYRSPVQPLCAAILSLLSLHPGMIEKGLYHCACVRPSRPMSPVPHYTSEPVNTVTSRTHSDKKDASILPEERTDIILPQETMDSILLQDRTDTILSQNKMDTNLLEERMDTIPPQKRTDSNLLEERTDSNLLEERTDSNLAEERTDTILPQKRTDSILPQKRTDSNLTEERTDSNLLEERTDSNLAEERTDTILPQKRTDSILPQKRTDSILPQKKTDSNLHEERTDTILPQKKLDTNLLKERTETNTILMQKKTDSNLHEERTDTILPQKKTNTNLAEKNKTILLQKKIDIALQDNTDIMPPEERKELEKDAREEKVNALVPNVSVVVSEDTVMNGVDLCESMVNGDKTPSDISQNDSPHLPRDTSMDTLGEMTMVNNLAAIAQIDAAACGCPLQIFEDGYLCLPYLSLPYMDVLSDTNVRGYFVGATNVLFKQKKRIAEVLVEVETGRVETADVELRRLLHLSTEDLRFADFLVRHVAEERHDVFVDGVGWEGGDEWIRAQFRAYLLCLLRTSLLQEGSRELDHFNASFVSAWRHTHNYATWVDGPGRDAVLEINPGHPFAGQLSVADMKLRLAHTMQNTEGGRKLNQAMVSTGRAVVTTGRAVGGAISHAKGALSNWWSNLTTVQSPTDAPEPAADALVVENTAIEV